jgi:hypothetical protein
MCRAFPVVVGSFFVAVAAAYRLPPVAAQGLPRPLLTTELCLAEETAALEQALALEVRRRMTAAAHAGATPPRFVLGCAGQLVTIRVFAGRGERMLERIVDVQSTPPAARSRLMALAAAELGDSLWDVPALPAATGAAAGSPTSSSASVVVTSPRPVVSAAAATSAASTAPRLLYLSADLRAFRGAAGILVGAAVGASVRRERGPGMTVDLVFDRAARQLELGRGTIALLSSRPAITATTDWHRSWFTAAAGVRFGVARLEGTPNATDVAGTTIWGAWGGPALSAGAGWSPFRRGTLTLMLEGGWTVARVVGRQGGAPALSLSGPWTAIQLGAGWP